MLADLVSSKVYEMADCVVMRGGHSIAWMYM